MIYSGFTRTRNDPAKDSLRAFTERTFPGYRNAAHLEKIDAALEAVERGDLKRLIIQCPPRHGKSDKASIHFPAWYLGRNPDKRVILTSYIADLAYTFSRRARNIVQSDEYPFNVKTAGDLSQVKHWDIEAHRGGLIAAGVGGPLTGQGANVLIIDDPIKNAEEAASERVRENVWDWYQSTAFTRLEPAGAVVIIMTRWHEDDLVGRVLANDPDSEWTVIDLPALALEDDPLGRKPGEALWPDRFPVPALEKIREEIGPRYFGALYQQRPAPDEGTIFHSPWLRFWQYGGQDLGPVTVKTAKGPMTIEPVTLPVTFDRTVQSWDMSFKETQTGSFVVGQVWSVQGSRAFLRDQIRERLDFPATIQAVLSVTHQWPDATQKLIEAKANGPAVMATLGNQLPGITPVETPDSKKARANAATWAFEAGNIYLPHPDIAPWVNDYIKELIGFPNEKQDDQVDATTQFVLKVLGRGSAMVQQVIARSLGWTQKGASADKVQSEQDFVPRILRRTG
jgi:predicted phage terminase large subunit-like protein